MKAAITLWIVWYVYWIVSARRHVRSTAGAPVKRESFAGRLGYTGMIAAGFALLFWHRTEFLSQPVWPPNRVALVLGLVAQAAGLAFAIWARHTLGANWAGRITIGGSQELVIHGPYRLVRHPIYSGLLLAVLGTAVIEGRARGFLGWLMVLAGVAIKLRREENALREHFGSAYADYARRVPAVLPLPWGEDRQ